MSLPLEKNDLVQFISITTPELEAIHLAIVPRWLLLAGVLSHGWLDGRFYPVAQSHGDIVHRGFEAEGDGAASSNAPRRPPAAKQ